MPPAKTSTLSLADVSLKKIVYVYVFLCVV